MDALVLIQAFLLKFSSCVTVRRKGMNQNFYKEIELAVNACN